MNPAPRSFQVELQNLINRYSKENGSDTPDFILAQYLSDALEAFDRACQARQKWYGRAGVPVEPPQGVQP